MAFGKPSTVGKPAAGKPTFGKKPVTAAGTGSAATMGAKPKYASTGVRISIKPSDQQHGGILDDADVLIKSMLFTTFDYNGQTEPGLSLEVVFQQENGEETTQNYSAGKLERMVPSADGRYTEQAVGANATGLNDNCNAGMFMRSLVEQGFPEDKIDEAQGSTEVFEGTVVHVNQQAQKKRAGLANQDDRQRTILLVTRILQLPWEAEGAAKPAAKAPAQVKGGKVSLVKPNGAAATSPADDLNDEAGAAILQVLEKNNGTVAKKVLGMQVFRVLGQSPNRSAILNLVASDDFLASENAPWNFDGTTLTAA